MQLFITQMTEYSSEYTPGTLLNSVGEYSAFAPTVVYTEVKWRTLEKSI